MNYKIGLWLVDEFPQKSGSPICQDFRETVAVIESVGLRMSPGIGAEVNHWHKEFAVFSLVLHSNPFAEYADLPLLLTTRLWYSNWFCGVVRGSLEQLQLGVECHLQKDVLTSDEQNVIRQELKILATTKDGHGLFRTCVI